jgi:hypothetical protein
LWLVGDTWFIEKGYNLTLPKWSEEIYQRVIENVRWGFYFDYRLPEMARLQTGGVLNEMIKNIQLKKSNESQVKSQLALFSSHDTYVAGMTKLLNLTRLNEPIFIDQPPYASSVTIELRRSTREPFEYFVQAYLKNNTANEPINPQLYSIDGCEYLCPLDKFLSLTKDSLVSDYKAACVKKNIDHQNSLETILTLAISISFVALISLALTIMTCTLCRKFRNNQYRPEQL